MNEATDVVDAPDAEVDNQDTSYDGSSDYDESVETQPEVEPEVESEEEPEVELTEKGTRKDPNPQSALHQELANERRARLQLEEQLRALVSQVATREDTKEEKRAFIDPEKLTNRESVAQAINQLYELLEQQGRQVQAFGSQFGQTREVLADTANFNSFEKEVMDSYKKYPELDETSDKYNRALDESIGTIYKKVAYDSQGRLRRDRPSFTDIADNYMAAVRAAQGVGEQRANTRTIQKQASRVNTIKKGSMEKSEDAMSDEELIAHRLGFK